MSSVKSRARFDGEGSRVLIVEDERLLARRLHEALSSIHCVVVRCEDGERAEGLVTETDFAVIILARTLPGVDGLELLERWRAGGVETPIMLMASRIGAEDRVLGLNCGADDYMTKPFSIDEFLARVGSLIRRRERSLRFRLAVGDLVMDPAAKGVTLAGEPVHLSHTEFSLLEYLLHRKGEVVTRTEISEHVWDDTFDALSNVVDVTVCRLRKRIDNGRAHPLLQTVAGVGYVLRSGEDPARAGG